MAAAAVQVYPPGNRAQYTFRMTAPAFQANDHNKGSAGGAASVVFNADPNRPVCVSQIWASYDAAPTGGLLTITDATLGVVWEQAITAAGPAQFTFDPPKCGSINSSLTVTLAAPGGAVNARLDVNAYVEK